MENNRLTVLTNSSGAVTVSSAESIAAVRLDRKRFPIYRDIPGRERQMWLAKQLLQLASISRTKEYTADEATVAAVALDERVADSKELSTLTIPEMEYAFRSGVFGAYGEYYGLSAVSLYGFLNSYFKSERKAESTRLVREAKEAQIRNEDEVHRARIRAEMEEAKRNGTFVPTGRFDFGRAAKSVNEALDTAEHRRRIEEQARAIKAGSIKI